MSATSKILGAMIIAFVIYITMRGQLPAYIQIFTGEGLSPNTGSPGTGTGYGSQSPLATLYSGGITPPSLGQVQNPLGGSPLTAPGLLQ